MKDRVQEESTGKLEWGRERKEDTSLLNRCRWCSVLLALCMNIGRE